MKHLFAKAKIYIGIFLISAIAVLKIMLGNRKRERDEARREAATHKRNTATQKAAREKEKELRQATDKARQINAQTDRERHETPKEERRTGRFGSTADRLERLHNKDGD